jgi:hypothetical protein
MKRIHWPVICLVLLTILPFILIPAALGQLRPESDLWLNAGPSGFSDGRADYINLAFGPTGNLLVDYSDRIEYSRATVKTLANNTWTTLGTAGFSPDTAEYLAMALSQEGLPVVSFRDALKM